MFAQVLHVIRNELTSNQRHVIILRFLEEFSLHEIAVIIGKKENSVKVIQNLALAKLRKSVNYRGNRNPVFSPRIGNLAGFLSIGTP